MDTGSLSRSAVRSVVVTFQLRDVELVRQVCARRGWEFRAGQRSFRRHGDWPGPCAHAIQVPGVVDQIGLRRAAGHWELDGGPALAVPLRQMMRDCFLAAVMSTGLRHGYDVGVPIETAGQLRLRLTKSGAIAHMCWASDSRLTLWTFGDASCFAALADALGSPLSQPEIRT